MKIFVGGNDSGVCKMMVMVLHFVIFTALTCSLPLETETRHRRATDSCTECAAGMYLQTCDSCSSCPDNTFTNKTNKEYSCHQCFMDCRPELHLQIVSPCSKTADVVCACMKDYVCNRIDKYTGQCKMCKLQPAVRTTTQPPAQSSFHTLAQDTLYTSEQTTAHPHTQMLFSTAVPSKDMPQGKLLEFSILILVLCIVFSFIIVCFYKRRKFDCLKKRLKKCSVRSQKVDRQTISSERNKSVKEISSTTETDCPSLQPGTREQPPSPSGNLGPLHIYGASTVFVSLLNQFGLNGGDKDEDASRQQSLKNYEIHGPSSPTIPLSTEEGNRDISYISFPFQEQGKECHMSKEEGL